MKKIAITLLALIAFTAGARGAPNFVDNNTSLPATKTDRVPVNNPTQQWSASDANTVFSALTDIRTVLQRNPAVAFNVKAFGATGGGSVDDSAAINSAIAAAAATVNGVFGAMVYFPKGVYRIGTQLVIPNGVGLRGDNPANTTIRASNSFSGTSLIKNQLQSGTQEFAFLEDLLIDGNAAGGAVESEAVVSWGSLFINSYMRDIIITGGSAVGLHVFAGGSPGGTGPVLFENVWVLSSGTDNVYIEDQSSNSGAFAGLMFSNLTSEHQGSNSAAIRLKGNGHAGQVNFINTHIEMGGSQTHRTGVTIDGFNDVLFTGLQIQAGTPANIDAGVSITSAAANLRIQIRGITNINGINPILSDVKNSVTFAAVHLPLYNTADIAWPSLPVAPVNGKSLIAQDSSGVARTWFDVNGRITGAGLSSAAAEILATPIGTPGASDDRGWIVLDHSAANPYGVYYPNGGGGVLRERMFTGGNDVRQIGTDGSEFHYQTQTFASNTAFQTSVLTNGGALPVLSACGTSPSVTAGSTNFGGSFTAGATATVCTLTFGTAFVTNAPSCIVLGGALSPTYNETTTTISFTAIAQNTKYRYMCLGH